MSCLALPSSHLLPFIPFYLFLFFLFSLFPPIPRWLLPAGAMRACEALHTAVALTYFHTASNSVWEVNLQWHVQYVAQMFLPSPELSHAIRSAADKGYGHETREKWSYGREVKQRLALTIMSSSYAPACSYLRTGDRRGGDVWGVWLRPSPLQVDVLHLREGAEEESSEWKLQFLPKPPLQFSFWHCPCLDSRKQDFMLLRYLLLCVGTSQLIYF